MPTTLDGVLIWLVLLDIDRRYERPFAVAQLSSRTRRWIVMAAARFGITF